MDECVTLTGSAWLAVGAVVPDLKSYTWPRMALSDIVTLATTMRTASDTRRTPMLTAEN